MQTQIVMKYHDLLDAFNTYDALYKIAANTDNLEDKARSRMGSIDIAELRDAYLENKKYKNGTHDNICVACADLCHIIDICRYCLIETLINYGGHTEEEYAIYTATLNSLWDKYLGKGAVTDDKKEPTTETATIELNDLIWLFNIVSRCNYIELSLYSEDSDDIEALGLDTSLREPYTIRKDTNKLRRLVAQHNCAGLTDPDSLASL